MRIWSNCSWSITQNFTLAQMRFLLLPHSNLMLQQQPVAQTQTWFESFGNVPGSGFYNASSRDWTDHGSARHSPPEQEGAMHCLCQCGFVEDSASSEYTIYRYSV